MNFMDFNLKHWQAPELQSLTLVIAIILFVASLLFGAFSGIALGKDQATLGNVKNIAQALKYFHNDQQRYPTADEFFNQKILTPYYMSDIPTPVNAASGTCQGISQYTYIQLDAQNYSLGFCLNSAISGFNQGVNQVKPG